MIVTSRVLFGPAAGSKADGLRLSAEAPCFTASCRSAHVIGQNSDLLLPLAYSVQTGQGEAMNIHVWGARGAIPSPGLATYRYGGNTPCVSLWTESRELLVFDAGTGIRQLGRHLRRSGNGHPLSGILFLSHHDPDRSDQEMDNIVRRAQHSYPHVEAAREGMEIFLPEREPALHSVAAPIREWGT